MEPQDSSVESSSAEISADTVSSDAISSAETSIASPVPVVIEALPTESPATKSPAVELAEDAPVSTEPKPSYVKLAMRNMVRKRGQSLQHFALTAIALLGILIGLSYLTR